MFLLIPVLAFLVLWAVLVRSGLGVRVAFLAAQVVNGVLIVFITEALSAFQTLTFWPLVIFWSAVLLIDLVLLYRLRRRPWPVWRVSPFDPPEKFFLVVTGLIVVITGLIAWVAPPNTNDSMVYHMARVANWAYNGTVANYPTKMLRQLVLQPYSEYAILQTYILSGSDRFANLVQWASMVGSLIGVSLIARMVGGNRRVQLLAVLFASTLPMGILQASSTQNDYVATLWAVCVIVFALFFLGTAQRRWGILCVLGFGLATLTKGTSVILSAPFLIWALWRVRWKMRHKVILWLLAIVITVIMNACFLQRLTQLSPNPFQAMQLGGTAKVASYDVRGLLSNVVRGMVTEVAMPSRAWNLCLVQSAKVVHKWLGIDINDPLPEFRVHVRNIHFFWLEPSILSGYNFLI